jgi:hypothetical protein
VPPELLEYVENGRNPDIYTREFVELVRRGNQLMRGKTAGFGAFRDVLAADMAAALLTAIPPLVVYFAVGKFFVRGITAGAIKG